MMVYCMYMYYIINICIVFLKGYCRKPDAAHGFAGVSISTMTTNVLYYKGKNFLKIKVM